MTFQKEKSTGVSTHAEPGKTPVLPFNVRTARLDDVPDLLAMIRGLAAFENLEAELQVTEDSLRSCLFGPSRVAYALMATMGSRNIGYAIYYRTFSTFVGRPGIFLEDIYVRPEYRRRGIGKALMQAVARIGAENNAGRFEWIALNWNKNALDFYAKLGMRTMGDWVLLRTDNTGLRAIAKGSA
jgi:GNAT superfamily N-acetyltransferase